MRYLSNLSVVSALVGGMHVAHKLVSVSLVGVVHVQLDLLSEVEGLGGMSRYVGDINAKAARVLQSGPRGKPCHQKNHHPGKGSWKASCPR